MPAWPFWGWFARACAGATALFAPLIGCDGCGSEPAGQAPAEPLSEDYPIPGATPLRGGESELSRLLRDRRHVFYLPHRRQYLVANWRTIYRLDADGYVVDFLEHRAPSDEGELTASGVMFGAESYCDWVHTDDPANKPYAPLPFVPAEVTREVLEAFLAGAEDFDQFSTFDKRYNQRFWVGVSRGGVWSRIPMDALGNLWEPMHNGPTSGAKPRARRIRQLQHDSRFDLAEPGAPQALLELAKFVHVRDARNAFLSEHRGFEGSVGRGYYALHHGPDVLRFEALARRRKSDPTRTLQDVLVFASPDKNLGAPGPLFVSLPDGLFVAHTVRTVTPAPRPPIAPFIQLRPIGIRLVGFPDKGGEWSHIRFVDGHEETIKQALSDDIAVAPRQVPAELNFYQEAPPEDPDLRMPLVLGEWTTDRSMFGTPYRIALDPHELLSVLTRHEGDTTALIEVTRKIREQVEHLEVSVQIGKEHIPLTQTRLLRQSSAGGIRYEISRAQTTVFYRQHRARLRELGAEAKTHRSMEPFMMFASSLDPDFWSADTKEHFATFVDLINQALRNGDRETGRQLYGLFLDTVRPYLHGALGARAEYLAADMVALAVHDRGTVEEVLSELFGDEAGLAATTNPRLWFNLACHHALTLNKPAMLAAARRALALGQAPESFLDDADFATYRNDADLLALLPPEPMR